MEITLYKSLNPEKFLEKHYPFKEIPKLTDKKLCIHCNKIITVGDFWIQFEYNEFTKKEEMYILCPNAPKCDGTVIDWINP